MVRLYSPIKLTNKQELPYILRLCDDIKLCVVLFIPRIPAVTERGTQCGKTWLIFLRGISLDYKDLTSNFPLSTPITKIHNMKLAVELNLANFSTPDIASVVTGYHFHVLLYSQCHVGHLYDTTLSVIASLW